MRNNSSRGRLTFTSARWPLAAMGATALCVGAFTVSVAHGATDQPDHELTVKPLANAKSFTIDKGTFSNGSPASGICLDFSKLKFDKDFAHTGLTMKSGTELHVFTHGVPCGAPPAPALGQMKMFVPKGMGKPCTLDLTKAGRPPMGNVPVGNLPAGGFPPGGPNTSLPPGGPITSPPPGTPDGDLPDGDLPDGDLPDGDGASPTPTGTPTPTTTL